ncbi:MAG: hypothetical protein WCK31_02725 [bacterium]
MEINTDTALKMHNSYARTEMLGSICIPGEKSPSILTVSELKKTLHLWPFLKVFVKELGRKLGRKVSPLSEDAAYANWIGREEVIKEVVSAKALIKGIVRVNREDPLRKKYDTYTSLLEGLNLVHNHMGVVALDCAIQWIELLNDSDSNKEASINSILWHLNTCAVKAIEVKSKRGKFMFHSWNFAYYENTLFHIDPYYVTIPPMVNKSLVNSWDKQGGYYSLHKNMVVEKLSSKDEFTTLFDYAGAQIYLLNKFILEKK